MPYLAGIQGQCDLPESCIECVSFMDDIIQGDERVDFCDSEYPALSELYHIVKDMVWKTEGAGH